jgi:uncharacterized protein YuzE
MKKKTKYTNEPMHLKVIPDFLPPPEKMRFRQTAVKVNYDTETDTLTLRLRDGKVARRDEVTKGVVVDFDEAGGIVGIELLDVSKRSGNPKALEFAVS